MPIRSPIICVLGHVDHGKTMILDSIRGTTIMAKEAGGITQHVGASFIPRDVIEGRCHELLDKYCFALSIPGLLFIDTPGHEAFTTLRKRGGSVADLAVLIIDITQGMQPQTLESIGILKASKTPFVVAANKIDLIDGWESHKGMSFMESFGKQRDFVKAGLDKKVYDIVGQLGGEGFNSERFDRVGSMTEEIMIIPVSAKTGEGIIELLMFLAGLSQKFIKDKLNICTDAPAHGTILEIKEVKGLGITADAIIYDGCIHSGDTVVMSSADEAVVTKIRALLEPAPLEEIRDTSKKFKSVKMVSAAAGVKIAAPGIDRVIPGSPIVVVKGNLEKVVGDVTAQVHEIIIETENEGVIVKADTLGSLEAITKLFKDADIPISFGGIGAITNKDVLRAEGMKKNNRYLGNAFVFNIKAPADVVADAEKRGVHIFASNVIYRLIEDYSKWKETEKGREREEQMDKYTFPAKMRIMPGCLFRASKPAVVGVQVVAGKIKPGYPLMKDNGNDAGRIVSIQRENETLKMAEEGDEVAIALDGVTAGRQICEEDYIYTKVPVSQLYELQGKIKDYDLIREILRIHEVNK